MVVNVLVIRGESSMAVIIDDVIEDEMRDEIEIHKVTVQMEGELLTVNRGVKRKKTGAHTSDIWTYFKIYSSDNKKAV